MGKHKDKACTVCDKSIRGGKLSRHMRTHIMGASSTRSQEASIELSRLCPICCKSQAHGNLYRHMRRMHQVEPLSVTEFLHFLMPAVKIAKIQLSGCDLKMSPCSATHQTAPGLTLSNIRQIQGKRTFKKYFLNQLRGYYGHDLHRHLKKALK